MTLTRFGKCTKCGTPTKAKKTFLENVSLLDPAQKTPLVGELLDDVRAWKKEPLHCDIHRGES